MMIHCQKRRGFVKITGNNWKLRLFILLVIPVVSRDFDKPAAFFGSTGFFILEKKDTKKNNGRDILFAISSMLDTNLFVSIKHFFRVLHILLN
jgi:hypothetical protein